MMQSLLADRFQLAAHFETQETPVLALRLVKPGKTGPNLRPQGEGPPCEDQRAAPQASRAAACYVQELNGKSDHTYLAGSRNTTMQQLAEVVSSLGRLDRVVVDQSGLTGGIDYRLEWYQPPSTTVAPNADPLPDTGPTFLEALRDQLGLKLESVKAPLRMLVIDHVERPSEN